MADPTEEELRKAAGLPGESEADLRAAAGLPPESEEDLRKAAGLGPDVSTPLDVAKSVGVAPAKAAIGTVGMLGDVKNFLDSHAKAKVISHQPAWYEQKKKKKAEENIQSPAETLEYGMAFSVKKKK